jgi:hypothetical protein
MQIVQKDADILWWSRDPKLDEEVNPGGGSPVGGRKRTRLGYSENE